MRPEPRQGRVRSWRLALLALLAVACSQLALAEHQFEHDAGVAGDVCAVCLQLEQFDIPHAAPLSGITADTPVSLDTTRNPAHVTPAAAAPYASRAPPRIY